MHILLTLLLNTETLQPSARPQGDVLAREVYKELIEINTTDPSGDNTRAAEAMAARLRAARFAAGDVPVLPPAPRKGNLVARLRGSTRQEPSLLVAHLADVGAAP